MQSKDTVETPAPIITMPSKPTKLRVLTVGCGAISKAWLEAAQLHYPDRFELAVFCDTVLAAAEARAREFGTPGARVGTALGPLLAEVRPDVVFNCTVPAAHCTVTTAALRAGAHVLSEKPLAATLEEGREIVRTARETGRVCAVVQNYRYNPGAVRVRQALAAGLIGEVHTLNVDFFRAPRFGGFRDRMRHVLLLDMSIHTFDLARFFSGRDADSVQCLVYNPPASWYDHGATAMATFSLGARAGFNYRGSWCADGHPTSWSGSWRIVGTKGTLLWDGEDRVEVEIVADPAGDGTRTLKPVVPPVDLPPARRGHAGMMGDFLQAIAGGGPPPTAVADNFRSFAMVECAVASAEQGARVAVASE